MSHPQKSVGGRRKDAASGSMVGVCGITESTMWEYDLDIVTSWQKEAWGVWSVDLEKNGAS